MRLEISSAAAFLSDLLRLSRGRSLTEDQLSKFRGSLEQLLCEHFSEHWFPERPSRGSGYRCIRINHKMDPMLAKAALQCGVGDAGALRKMFPSELTLWIDPREVSYRIGENGSICVLYDAAELERYAAPTTCKGSVRGMDGLIMDNGGMDHHHQFTHYVSS